MQHSAFPLRRIIGLSGLLALFLCLLGAHTYFSTTPPANLSPQAPTLSQTTLEACTSKGFECYDDYLVPRTINDGPAAAFADIKAAYETDSYVKSQCHQLAHVIGRAALQKYATIKPTFEQGDSFCWSGYYHGAVEQAIADIGPENIKAQANQLCSGFSDEKRYSFDHFNCVHGMGHGFMAVENMVLFPALDDCDLLKDSWEKESCYGGVFMENVMIEARGDGLKSNYLDSSRPMYPCTEVSTARKQQCYLMQTSYALQRNNYDFSQTFEQCRTIPDAAFIDTCYQSLGRDASGNSTSDITLTQQNCQFAPDQRGLINCALGAVRDFISYYHDDTKARQLCATFASTATSPCLEEAARYYATFR